jgi:hypothetical protein
VGLSTFRVSTFGFVVCQIATGLLACIKLLNLQEGRGEVLVGVCIGVVG